MLRKTSGGIERLEYGIFDSCKLKHASFLRHGGVSSGPFASLNFGLAVGDEQENVRQNTLLALETVGVSFAYSAHQCHGKNVVEITHGFKNPVTADALMTNEKGVALMIKHADCQAAIIYDPSQHACAAVHAGWRGSVQNIYRETIDAMAARYGSRPQELLVAISPSLGPLHAEFKNYESELPRPFWEHQVKPLYFDFWEISRLQLQACGVLPHNIEIARMCTHAHEQDCFSYRRNPKTGRHATVVTLID